MEIRKRTSTKPIYESDHETFEAAVKEAIEKKIDFRETILDLANLQGCNIDGLNFIGAQLLGTNLSKASAKGSIFTAAIMDEVVIKGGDFKDTKFIKTNLTRANAENVDFEGSDLSKSIMADARFPGCQFKNCVMGQIDAQKSNFNGANFAGTDLRRSNFADAELGRASFVGCDLRGVNFSRASLQNTDFTDALITSYTEESVNQESKTEKAHYDTIFAGANLIKSVGLNPYAVNPLMILLDQPAQIRAYMLINSSEAKDVSFGKDCEAEGDQTFTAYDLVKCFARRDKESDLFVIRFRAEDIVEIPLSPNGSFYIKRFQFVEKRDWEKVNPSLQ